MQLQLLLATWQLKGARRRVIPALQLHHIRPTLDHASCNHRPHTWPTMATTRKLQKQAAASKRYFAVRRRARLTATAVLVRPTRTICPARASTRHASHQSRHLQHAVGQFAPASRSRQRPCLPLQITSGCCVKCTTCHGEAPAAISKSRNPGLVSTHDHSCERGSRPRSASSSGSENAQCNKQTATWHAPSRTPTAITSEACTSWPALWKSFFDLRPDAWVVWAPAYMHGPCRKPFTLMRCKVDDGFWLFGLDSEGAKSLNSLSMPDKSWSRRLVLTTNQHREQPPRDMAGAS
jgi:hypothetical protein